MRWLTLLLLLLVASLAGCVNDAPGDGGDSDMDPASTDSDSDGFTDSQEETAGTDPNDAASTPQPPEAIHFEGNLIGIAECTPVGVCPAVSDAGCVDNRVPYCADHPFTVESPGWKTSLLLTSESGTVTSTADYDLFVFDSDGNSVGQSTNPGGDEDKVTKSLAAGDYVAQIVAWNNQDAPYNLDITFAF